MNSRPCCAWAESDPLLRAYHDREWGVPVRTDTVLFERMALEIFQAGLSWRLMLVKRAAFARAFAGWRIEAVAGFTPRDVERLLGDASIVRNRRKIEAMIENAAIARELQRTHRSFRRWFYEVLNEPELPALQRRLRGQFRFMGPTIAQEWLMSCGKIPAAHEPGCFRLAAGGR